jgi:hypothetical protein
LVLDDSATYRRVESGLGLTTVTGSHLLESPLHVVEAAVEIETLKEIWIEVNRLLEDLSASSFRRE